MWDGDGAALLPEDATFTLYTVHTEVLFTQQKNI